MRPEFDGAVYDHLARQGSTMDFNPDTLEGYERMQAFLLAQPKEELVRRLLDLSNIDSGLRQELQHWCASAQRPEVSSDPQAMAALITDMMTPASTEMERRDVPHYVRRASEALPLLRELMKRDASAAARVLEHVILVAWQVTSDSTDDEQEAPDFARSLMQLHLQALEAANPQQADFAARLVRFLRADPLGLIDMGQILAVVDHEARRCVGSYLDTVTAHLDQRAQQLQSGTTGHGKPRSGGRSASRESEVISLRREQDQVRHIREAFDRAAARRAQQRS